MEAKKHQKSMSLKKVLSNSEYMDELNTGTMTPEEINFEMKYPTKKVDPVVKYCPTCGSRYTYNNYNHHIRTKVHKAYQNMNEKLIKVLKMTD